MRRVNLLRKLAFAFLLLPSCTRPPVTTPETPTDLPRDSRAVFLEKLRKVSPNMHRSEVEEIMNGYTKGTGWPYSSSPKMTILGSRKGEYELDTSATDQLTLKGCEVYRHSDEGQYDSDWGIVCFENERAVWADFAPD